MQDGGGSGKIYEGLDALDALDLVFLFGQHIRNCGNHAVSWIILQRWMS